MILATFCICSRGYISTWFCQFIFMQISTCTHTILYWKLINNIYFLLVIGGRKPVPLQRVMILEVSQYLENYLWPNFSPETASFEHVMSMILMVNEKVQWYYNLFIYLITYIVFLVAIWSEKNMCPREWKLYLQFLSLIPSGIWKQKDAEQIFWFAGCFYVSGGQQFHSVNKNINLC